LATEYEKCTKKNEVTLYEKRLKVLSSVLHEAAVHRYCTKSRCAL